MKINEKVLYGGNVYKIIFDYHNGQYEIMRDNFLKNVLLVNEEEIKKL